MNKLKKYSFFLLALVAAIFVQSCKENIDMSDRYTYTEESVASYLQKHPDTYSTFYWLLSQVKISNRSQSDVQQLMTARGNYTVFAPTNEAIQNYLDTLAQKGIINTADWEGFPNQTVKDSIMKVIVFNSIIDGGDETEAYQTSSFPEKNGEEFTIANMNDRKLSVTYGNDPDSVYINGTCLIDLNNRDIIAINGYIHEVHSVIAPSNESLGDLLKNFLDEGTEGYNVTARVIQACGLFAELSQIRDEVYEEKIEDGSLAIGVDGGYDYYLPKHSSYGKYGYLPEHRKYGFTIFAETDDFWSAEFGKPATEITLEELEAFAAKYYPEAATDGNYKNPNNALYKFITYHILPERLPSDKLVIHYNESGYNYKTSTTFTVPTCEIYTTIGERRLLKLYQCGKRYSLDGTDDVYVNRFPVLDNGRQGTYKEVSCDDANTGAIVDKEGKEHKVYNVINGMIYPINKVIAYDETTRTNLQKQRLRFDAASLFPEWMNNDIRADRVGANHNMCVAMPCDNDYKYLENLEIMDGTNFYYLLGLGLGWQNYQGDEINVTGRYEMILTLPPVPVEGTYEIRYAVQTNSGQRGMCQVYFGSNKENLPAIGIPLDLRMGGQIRKTSAGNFASIVGWELDNQEDDDYNAEVDKKMRNNGFMKGPRHYAGTPGSSSYARTMEYLTRRIIVREYMYPDRKYYLKFKSVLDDETKEFYMDYIELCAKEVYDNPQTPEDIW